MSTWSPVIVYLWGDDGWAMDRAVLKIARDLERDSGATPDRWRVTGKETTPDAIAERVATAPMFGGGTVAVITDPGPLLASKAGKEAMERLLGQVAPGNALVLVEATTDPKKRSQALQGLEAAVMKAGGESHVHRAPKPAELIGWIMGRAAAMEINLEGPAAQALAARIGGLVSEGDVDRRGLGTLAVAELEKLSLYRLGAPVTADDVAALVPEAVPSSTWGFLDAVGDRNVRKAARMLEPMLETTPEPLILVQLHRRLRELLIAADHHANRGSNADLVKLLGIHPFRVERAAETARRWTVPELETAIEGVQELDAAVKGVEGSYGTESQRRLAFATWLHQRVTPRTDGAPGAGSRS